MVIKNLTGIYEFIGYIFHDSQIMQNFVLLIYNFIWG